MKKDDRTIDDLNEAEYQEYEKYPEKHEDITENTINDILGIMNPNGEDED